jgi:cation:H+ antiporter
LDLQLFFIILVKFLAGLTLLTVGAEGVVRGGSRLAALFGIPPLIIGLTIVSIGTSAPELAVSIDAALQKELDITMGNIIGSNIANLLLILGICAVIAPLAINKKIVTFDTPFLIAVSGLTWFLANDLDISFLNGLVLLVVVVGYTAYLIYRAREKGGDAELPLEVDRETLSLEKNINRPKAFLISTLYLAVGGIMLTYGAELFVGAASQTARVFGVSQLVIGLTVVAVGTSLPEIATSVLASVRGELDIAVGNVVGSCIFNLVLVLGIAAVIEPIRVSGPILDFDLPVMFFITLACWPIFIAYMTVSRGEGVLMLLSYFIYIVVVVLESLQSSYLPYILGMLGYVVIPFITFYLLWRVYCSRHLWLESDEKHSPT